MRNINRTIIEKRKHVAHMEEIRNAQKILKNWKGRGSDVARWREGEDED
jgi:hypothetical protein